MGWAKFLRRERWDRERLREIESYVQIETDENIARGIPPAAAREAARRKFGNLTQVREEIYQMNTIGFVDSLARDLRHTLRAMRHNLGFTTIAILTLALGIGATTTIFSVVNGVLLQPLPYPESRALIGVWNSARLGGKAIDSMNLTAPMYLVFHEQNRTFQDFGVWNSAAASVTGTGDPEQVPILSVTQGLLPALEIQPVVGRWFTAVEDSPQGEQTALLTYGYWQARFGGDPAVLGRTINIDSRPTTIIGVMPENFHFLNMNPRLILPLRFDPERLPSNVNYNYQGIARLKPGVSMEQASADVDRMLPIWAATPGAGPNVLEVARYAPALRPLKNDVVGDVGEVLWVVMGTVGLVLLIACANVANLLLVRAEGRQQELAIRAALGAGWSRIARELLVESVTLGVLGGALGLGLAYGGLRILVAIGPTNLPRLSELSIDSTVLAFALLVSLISGLLFGLIPIFKYAGPRMSLALRSGRSASISKERHRSQNVLVVFQVALALVLLVSSGLMIRSFQALRNVEPGFTDPDHIQTLRVTLPPAQVQEPERVIRLQQQMLDKLAAIPGVTSAAFATALPTDFQNSNAISAEGITPEGQIQPIRRAKFISPGLLKVQGTPLIAGRDFTWTDVYENREVAMVSENLARETWGSASAAIGKRIRLGAIGVWREVIGVAGNVYDNGVQEEPASMVYWRVGPQSSIPNSPVTIPRSVVFEIRSDRTGSEAFLKQVHQAVWSVNPNLPVAQVRTLGEVYNQSLARTSFTLVMLAIAGSLALILGVIGIYGVISYAVSQRNREIGIRLALGAQPGALQSMFVRHGITLAVIGVILGLGGAAALTRLMSSLLFGISPLDPVTYGAGALILTLAAALASYLPARRASAVDPVIALRAE